VDFPGTATGEAPSPSTPALAWADVRQTQAPDVFMQSSSLLKPDPSRNGSTLVAVTDLNGDTYLDLVFQVWQPWLSCL
jgi:hypothetical protein